MADHKDTGIPGLTAERVKAAATLAVTLVTGVNAVLSMSGHNPLPWSDTEVYSAISGVLAFASTVYAWWRNQNVTTAAVEGAKLTKALKKNATAQGTSTPPDIAPVESTPSDDEILAATQAAAEEIHNA